MNFIIDGYKTIFRVFTRSETLERIVAIKIQIQN